MGISRVLIANRGEIALRIIKACHDLGIETVAVVSEIDRESKPANEADRAVCIGPSQAVNSYLKVKTIVAAALGSGADAIHPGYGFLAEQPDLVEACQDNNLTFIGPTADNIRKMGDKLLAREMIGKLGIPVIPGSEMVSTGEEAKKAATALGFPVLIKAAAGGGGKGIKTVNIPGDLKDVFSEASGEALAAFGDGRVFVERYIPNARHIEVQVMGDSQGNIVHLFERDCSLQRRYQKILEEAPSPVVTEELRKRICDAAVRVATHIGYENAGTIEFVFDQDQNLFYFLEMNTRIQVEHPITEMITGIDLVKEQIIVAAGNPLSICQKDIKMSGHSIECRINAESPGRNFHPSPGRINLWGPPKGDGIRIDSHCYSGYFVPPYYDSLLAKLVTWGDDRSEAIKKMQYALDNFTISGVDTTVPFHRYILQNNDYLEGKINTRWIEDTVLREYEK
ncbi:MAG: acetyl-CoA carboxylase biotin carboxylase subunit [Deltaproteobacteria bacterium]|nr:acetyl-CoA carboxylase biotin carboxylase subunit [Deltaproteobacteria bacterium]